MVPICLLLIPIPYKGHSGPGEASNSTKNYRYRTVLARLSAKPFESESNPDPKHWIPEIRVTDPYSFYTDPDPDPAL
jgi:hypothetical protein